MNYKTERSYPDRRPAPIIGSLFFSLIIGGTCQLANAAVIDGREWRQPLDTVDLSYVTIATVCDVGTGVCNGPVENTKGLIVDLTGWTWANVTDVARFFETLTGQAEGTFDEGIEFPFAGGSSWALAAIDNDRDGADPGLFHFTAERTVGEIPTIFSVLGLTRSLVSRDNVNHANRSYFQDNGVSSRVVFDNPIELDAARAVNGAWLYKTVVPVPSAAWLLGSALMGLIAVRRNTSRYLGSE